jgi:hypothetical protein
MAKTFDEGSAFDKEHQETWTSFTRWAKRGTVFVAILVIIAFIFIVS